jgi:hypothetical protein
MSFKTINARLDRMATTPPGHADQMGLNFLLQICSRLHDLGMGHTDPAKRMGTLPAYIARLLGGSTKLAHATYGEVQIEFVPHDAPARSVRGTGSVALS